MRAELESVRVPVPSGRPQTAAETPFPREGRLAPCGNKARRGAKGGLRPLSGPATRSRQLFHIHVAKESPATHEWSLMLVVLGGGDNGDERDPSSLGSAVEPVLAGVGRM
jgi:hypothetical protein